MEFDVTGTPVSFSCPGLLAEWNAMIRAFLAHRPSVPDHLNVILAACPDNAMALATKGLFAMLLGRREMIALAQEAYAQARASADVDGRDGRAQFWLEGLASWLAGHPSGTVDALEKVLDRHPTDTLSAKLSHAIRFMYGDPVGMRQSVERVMPAHGHDHPLRGFLLGCHAFALEETGDYAQAESIGHEALAVAPDDAWGLHAVAHVHDMQARPDLGLRFIDENRSAWDGCNNFRYHVWWHKALLHLDRGETEEALSLYDSEIRADKTDDYRDIANATSLLVRLELYDIPVADRWEELADLAERRSADGCLVFADLHYAIALAAAGRNETLVDLTLRYARTCPSQCETAGIIADPGRAALAGVRAFAEGRYDRAFAHLTAARHRLQGVGGSHAQRDVFERMAIDAGIRCGQLDDAHAMLKERARLRGNNLDEFAAARLQTVETLRRIPAQ